MIFSKLPYERPDFSEMVKQANVITNELSNAKSFEDASDAVRKMGDLQKHEMTLAAIVEIRHTVDTRDAFYESEQDYFDENSPSFQSALCAYYRALLASSFRSELERYFGNQLFASADLFVRSFDEKMIPFMVEENKLTSAYQKLIASASIELDGITYNLKGLEVLMQSPDRCVRKRGFHAYAGFFSEHESELDDLYDKLVKVRTAKAQAIGFNNFVPLGYLNMGRMGYGPEEVALFRKQVCEELVPVCRKLLKDQEKRIGVDSLKYYDEAFQFPDGNATPIGNKDELVEQAEEMYDALSPETGEFFRFMRENELLDLETKPGKAAGGYTTGLPEYASPFIFSNFNGTSADVDVLTHEAGHAFQDYTTEKQGLIPEYITPSMEAAEIHSMSMEYFTYPWMEKFFGVNADKYRFLHTFEGLTFVPYGCLVDEFQHRVYEQPEMTPAERKAVWRDLEKKYLPLRDYDGEGVFEHGGFYFQKLHIFMYPFYYIDYCLASMAAFEMFGKMQEDRDAAWNDYYKLCKLGGSMRYIDLLKEAHLSDPFAQGSVKKAIEPMVKSVIKGYSRPVDADKTPG